MAEFTLKMAREHLARNGKAGVTDVLIAERATAIVRTHGWTGSRDRVSRPLVNMIRRGASAGRRGLKVWAIWEALRQLKLIPALPAEVTAWTKSAGFRDRNPGSVTYWRDRFYQIKAQLAVGGADDVKEVPVLTPAMLRYFGLERNPVFDEIRHSKDVWWGRQHQEAKAVLIDAAEEGRFVRLAGRRGAGKSLVAQAVQEELRRREDLIIVEPSAVITGVLTETHLLSAVIQAIKRRVDGRDELFAEPQNPTKRALAMRYHLVQQRKAGRRVVLWIDEAHELQAKTFIALKRFLDEVEGLGRRLLSVILIGQNPEAAYNPRARDLSEVTLRLQTYKLQPMHDEIPDYLRFKLQRAGANVSEIISPAALKALAQRCPYPLDANVLFAELLIRAYAEKEKPIGREYVTAVAPEDEAEVASA